METFIQQARSLNARIAERPEERESFGRFAAGQSPLALFITCSDSRVVPSFITGARPGELFELRTAGNAVPAYREDMTACAEAATIEYAMRVLKVADIVVCGHSHCGAVGARARAEDLNDAPCVRDWLADQFSADLPLDDSPAVPGAVQRHVREQLDRLRAYPSVRERMDAGEVTLHGWFYEVHTGLVMAHDQETDAFLPL
ncbi:carbonic anhydrase [Streptomyces purpurogeneiscleroticus]|uniref:carbonic anhydrase n=1 Tax=Streptomyces purpurogeneiscleroticus TaxID=68259 RepID=UPI001CC13E10|nr:carbonic anhydrase [Streptomyces purpurogeneiscleroticus]MBZ4015263.1 carbonic anhydrase [Streptomyces purpurogeneiscleroticus]